MSQVFFISDTHFGHKNIIVFESKLRPFDSIEEHDECLVDNWNRVVTKRDVVYHLGDVLFGRDAFKYLDRLKGTKKLILGNHDRYQISEYAKYFSKISGAQPYSNWAILTHIPIHPMSVGRYGMNIHGHLHNSFLPDLRYYNVSCELVGLTPIPEEIIREDYEQQTS